MARTIDTHRALDELADRLDDIATGARSGRLLGRRDAQIAATAARHIRAIPEALAAGMREAFVVGREYGHREVDLADRATRSRSASTSLARDAWGGGNPGNA